MCKCISPYHLKYYNIYIYNYSKKVQLEAYMNLNPHFIKDKLHKSLVTYFKLSCILLSSRITNTQCKLVNIKGNKER